MESACLYAPTRDTHSGAADLDRSPAVKGQVRPDKLTIVFEQPDEKLLLVD